MKTLKINYRWDDQPGVKAGWFCEVSDGDRVINDSQKISFPVDVEDYDQDQEADLVSALREAFPDAEIE